jgi:molybdate transport system ATP-binding protein
MIELKHVAVVKGGVTVWKNLNWRIEAGEHWVISGKNGSGKTGLLEIIAGHQHATTGEVLYDFVQGAATWDERFALRKKNIHYIAAHALQSFLQQHEMFYQQRYYSMGDERVPVVRDILGEDAAAALQALDLPATFNLDALLEIEVTRLSNGQLKKVMILNNLVRGLPKVLLFDYPFEGLDYASRKDLAAFIDHLARRFQITIIVADHDHHLPTVINRRLIVDNHTIRAVEEVRPAESSTGTASANAVATGKGAAVVEMKHVTIQYGSRTIIEDFNWVIRQGERWALTGKNGSGKTTLFSLIFADHPMAYSQSVSLFGKRRGSGESIWDIKNRINYLGPELISYLDPQHKSETARNWILRQHKQLASDALEHALVHFDATSFMDTPIKLLSSGQLQIMLIISTLVSGKELLLLDEPFQFLDPINKLRLNDYLHEHLHDNTTLVLITHYEEDIARWTQHRMQLSRP